MKSQQCQACALNRCSKTPVRSRFPNTVRAWWAKRICCPSHIWFSTDRTILSDRDNYANNGARNVSDRGVSVRILLKGPQVK